MKNLISISLSFVTIFAFSIRSYAINAESLMSVDSASSSLESSNVKKKSKKKKTLKRNISEEQYVLANAYYRGAFTKKDYAKALDFIKKSAAQNNPKAQCTLASFYENATCGLDKDIQKAVELYEKSAVQNNSNAIFSLARLYYKGEGVDKDIDKALDLFITSANLDINNRALFYIKKIYLEDLTNAKALYNVALLTKKSKDIDNALEFFKGVLRTEYKEEAIKEIEELVSDGNDKAQYVLGKLYEEGEYIDISINKAIKNYELAAKQENKDACIRIKELAKEKYSQAEYVMGYLYHNGIYYSKDLGDAIYWYNRAVKQYNKDAVVQLEKAKDEHYANTLSNLACVYKDGTAKEQKKAFNYVKRSASLGNIFSISNLGVCYEKGIGVKQDYNKAFKQYLKGAKLGEDTAQLNLARAYRNGRGVDVDLKKCFEYLEKSAAQDNLDAIVDLGIAYEKGNGVEVDMQKAIELFTLGMERDDAFATFKMAAFYEYGKYVKKDPQLALSLFKKSALLGEAEAIKVLEEYRQAAEKGDREAIKLIENLE